jgi:hypothetical protein
MKRELFYVAILIACASYGCTSGEEVASDECFPLGVGNRWTYVSGNDTIVLSVAGSVELNNRVYARVLTENPDYCFLHAERRFACDSTGNVLSCDIDVSVGGEFILPPDFTCSSNIWYKFDALVGEQWYAYAATNSQVRAGAVLSRYALRLESNDDTVSFAGVPHRAMRFYVEDLRLNERGYQDWVVPGIGLVKRQGGSYPCKQVYLLIRYDRASDNR